MNETNRDKIILAAAYQCLADNILNKQPMPQILSDYDIVLDKDEIQKMADFSVKQIHDVVIKELDIDLYYENFKYQVRLSNDTRHPVRFEHDDQAISFANSMKKYYEKRGYDVVIKKTFGRY